MGFLPPAWAWRQKWRNSFYRTPHGFLYMTQTLPSRSFRSIAMHIYFLTLTDEMKILVRLWKWCIKGPFFNLISVRWNCFVVVFIRVTERKINVDSLLHCAPSALHSGVSVVRDPTTGMLMDFTEVGHEYTFCRCTAFCLFVRNNRVITVKTVFIWKPFYVFFH